MQIVCMPDRSTTNNSYFQYPSGKSEEMLQQMNDVYHVTRIKQFNFDTNTS